VFKTIRGLQDAQNVLTPDEKREYLGILLTHGEQAARDYLRQET